MRHLAELLKIELAHAVGIMEMIWHSAGQETPQGDIGSALDSDIAYWCAWRKKPEVLVAALLDAGWIESHPEYRLLIHDWPDHCEQTVRKWLARKKQKFLPVYGNTDAECPPNVRTVSAECPPNVRTVSAECPDSIRTASIHTRAGLAWLGLASEGVKGEPQFLDPNGGLSSMVDRLCTLHRKTGDRSLVERTLVSIISPLPDGEQAARAELIESRHQKWCETEWNECDKRFVPKLSTWLIDGGWRDEPNGEPEDPHAGAPMWHPGDPPND